MQSSVLEWNYHFSNLIMEVMPQFLIMLPVNPPSPTPPSKRQKLGLNFIIYNLIIIFLLELRILCESVNLAKLYNK